MSTLFDLDTQTPGRGGKPHHDVVAQAVPATAARTDAPLAGTPTSPPASGPPKVLGLDLSLTGTGVAGPGWTQTLKPSGLTGIARIDWIRNAIVDRYLTGVVLVAIEGPSYGSQDGKAHERAGLWWIVVRSLWRRDVPHVVIPPSSVKKYATGKGNAGKDDVIREVARRFGWFEGDNNQADALILAAMAADHLGHPLAAMPQTHRAALAAIAWPEPDAEVTG